jgi:hypothetical protein
VTADGRRAVTSLPGNAERRLRDGHLQAEENTRLQRGLLPNPLLSDTKVSVVSRYLRRPCRTVDHHQ